MRLSIKEQQIQYHVKELFAFKPRECSTCRSLCRFDFMYEVFLVPETPSCAFFCKYCMRTAEEAYDAVFTHKITASEMIQANDIRFLQMQIEQETNKVRVAKDTFNSLIKLAMEIPNGEMTPFVMQAIVAVENASKKL